MSSRPSVLVRLFRRQAKETPATHASGEREAAGQATQAPDAEESTDRDPPPYSASSGLRNGRSASQESGQETILISPTTEFLDPSLGFTASLMEQQWREKDRIFARAVVQFIAERFDGNLKGWAGYKYTHISEVKPCSATPMDLCSCGNGRMRILRGKRVLGMSY